MPRSHPVRPVFVGRDLGPGGFELATKAYCAVTHRKQRLGHAADPLGKVARRPHRRLPDLFLALVERREHLASLGVEHGQDRRAPAGPGGQAREATRRRSARRPLDCASPRAVAIPIRRPVKVPGPRPTAIRSTESQPPGLASDAPRPPPSSSRAWRGRPVGVGVDSPLAERRRRPAVSATLSCAVEVSKPRTRCTA